MKSISIITVVYNGEDVLAKTIESVIAQLYSAIEYIIIDGQSTDGTHRIIEKFESNIDQIVIEADEGIYDAMNKGLNLAQGDYVLFLNAGDYLNSPDTIQNVMKHEKSDIYYGETYLVDQNWTVLGTRSELTSRKLPKDLNWKSIKMGLVVCHQSLIVRRSIAPLYIADNLSADIDWVIQSLKNSKRIKNTDMIISRFLVGGISKQRHWTSLKDRFKVMSHHYGFIQTIILHKFFMLRWLYRKIF